MSVQTADLLPLRELPLKIKKVAIGPEPIFAAAAHRRLYAAQLPIKSWLFYERSTMFVKALR